LIDRGHVPGARTGELFARHVTRTALDVSDFAICKQRLIDRGERFATKADVSRTVIAENMRPFLRDGMTILVHGYSNVVCTGLLSAAKSGMRFKVMFVILYICYTHVNILSFGGD